MSLEKSQLEMNIINSEKAAQRMSQNVEELQWRIKNNFELPVDFFQKPLTTNKHPTSFQGFSTPLEKYEILFQLFFPILMFMIIILGVPIIH